MRGTRADWDVAVTYEETGPLLVNSLLFVDSIHDLVTDITGTFKSVPTMHVLLSQTLV